MKNESEISRYVKASATVIQYFPVDSKGNPDISCMQCRFFRRASRMCALNDDELCVCPQKHIGINCPLNFDMEEEYKRNAF